VENSRFGSLVKPQPIAIMGVSIFSGIMNPKTSLIPFV
jgi:hypothetical protein